MLTKYRQQPFYVRWSLWWRYMPLAIVTRFIPGLACWGWHGFGCADFGEGMKLTRWRTFILLWRGSTVFAHSDMGNTFTIQECLTDLEAKGATDGE